MSPPTLDSVEDVNEGRVEMLRRHSQTNGRKLIDVAEAVVESHTLLVPAGSPKPQS